MTELISIHEAQQIILSVKRKISTQPCQVEEAYGRRLAENILSPVNLPPFTNSSMDGFAVCSEDVTNASPHTPIHLPVKLDIPAGFAEQQNLTRGTAARILTGAPLPIGADAVVPIENTDQSYSKQTISLPNMVAIFSAAKPGDNTRHEGADIQSGQVVLKTGRMLKPQDIGLLISLGIRQVQVEKKVRIAVFTSGDELLTLDQPMTPGKIYDSNGYVLAGALRNNGTEVIQLGIARDNPESMKSMLDKAVQNAPELIIASGGVSVGVFDYVYRAIAENGRIAFWRVNMRPGKPILFGYYRDIPFLGLPGNPVSSYIGYLVFALPLIRHLQGLPPFNQKTVKAKLAEPLESPDGRECYYRGIIRQEEGIHKAYLTGNQDSGNLFSLVQANALLIVPAGQRLIPAGEEVTAWVLESELE